MITVIIQQNFNKIKSFFPLKIGKIFSNLKIPKITVNGGKAPFGIGGQGKKPSFDIKWNAKGAIFSEPTIFATAKGFQGVGEAGAEAVAPIDTLQQYVARIWCSSPFSMGYWWTFLFRSWLHFLLPYPAEVLLHSR